MLVKPDLIFKLNEAEKCFDISFVDRLKCFTMFTVVSINVFIIYLRRECLILRRSINHEDKLKLLTNPQVEIILG